MQKALIGKRMNIVKPNNQLTEIINSIRGRDSLANDHSNKTYEQFFSEKSQCLMYEIFQQTFYEYIFFTQTLRELIT